MSLRLEELTIDDALRVFRTLPAAERALMEAIDGEPYEPVDAALRMMRAPGMHFTIMAGAFEVIAAGGFVRQRPGVFRTWFAATDAAWHPHGADVTALVKSVISRMLADKLAHRIETITLADRSLARRWYKKIGLRFESTLSGFCANGADAVTYVATRSVET